MAKHFKQSPDQGEGDALRQDEEGRGCVRPASSYEQDAPSYECPAQSYAAGQDGGHVPDEPGRYDPDPSTNVYMDADRTGFRDGLARSGRGSHGGPRKRHHVLAWVLGIIAAVVVVLGVSGYFFYRSAKVVVADASAMVQQTNDFVSSVASGDTSTVAQQASDIQALSTSMRQQTQSPLWGAAQMLPVVGPDVSKVVSLVSVAGDLSDNVLVPAAQSLNGMSMGTLFQNGKVDVASVSQLCNVVAQVQPAIANDAQTVDALGDANIQQINEPLQKVRSTLDQLNSATATLSKVAPSLPSMLGANGTRTYLVVAQNNSEIRSTGGFPGSRMIVTVSDGQLQLGDFQAVGGHFADGQIPLTDEERTVVSDIMQTGAGYAPGDVNAVPSFPRAAQLMEWCWQQSYGQGVDGVVAVDPVFLQSLLGLTGGVTTSDGTVVDGTNAAEILLNKIYFLDPELQDPFFGEVAGLALQNVMNNLGSVSMKDLATTVRDGVKQGRLLLYMNDATEESAIDVMGADGQVNQDPTQPQTGFYVYDKTGSKLDWYLDLRSQVSEPTTNADGSKSYNVTVTLGNTTTLEQMQNELSDYIVGVTPQVHHYSMITSYLIMAPAGGSISNLQVSSDEVNAQQEASLYGNDVWAGYVNIYPSSTATFTYTVTTSPQAQTDLTVWTTPTGRSFQ